MLTDLEAIIILIATAVVMAAIFQRLNMSPVLGYLLAGAIIGPYGAEITKQLHATEYLAEFGVVFLLFYIGLELTYERLKTMRRFITEFGMAQLLITSGVFFLSARMFGLSDEASIIIGGGLALSSTAIVLQLLEERGLTNSKTGRLSVSLLIAQDFAVVPLLVLVPLLVSAESNLLSSLFEAVVKALVAMAAIIIFGRVFLRPVFAMIGSLKSRELFTATTLLLVLGAAYVTEYFGLSLALGAFLAGLMVAETEYQHQVEADILPFKTLLLGLFFMTIGMHIDLEVLQKNIGLIIGLASGLIIIKALIIGGLCMVFKFRLGSSLRAGLLLSQGGEFAFVLFNLAEQQRLLSANTTQLLLVVVGLSMALTPLLASIGEWLARKLNKESAVLSTRETRHENQDLSGHIVIAGYGMIGQVVATLLERLHMPYVILDTDTRKVSRFYKKNVPIYFGSADRRDVLYAVGFERAAGAVITFIDKETSLKAITTMRKLMPEEPIVARAWHIDDSIEMEEKGADLAVSEAEETSLRIGEAMLQSLGITAKETHKLIAHLRKEIHPAS